MIRNFNRKERFIDTKLALRQIGVIDMDQANAALGIGSYGWRAAGLTRLPPKRGVEMEFASLMEDSATAEGFDPHLARYTPTSGAWSSPQIGIA